MYGKFLRRFLFIVLLFVVSMQLVFMLTAMEQLRQSIVEVDTQALAAFKSAARSAQVSVYETSGVDVETKQTDDFNYQLTSKLQPMYRYYYVHGGSGIARSNEYANYCSLVGKKLKIDGKSPFNIEVDLPGGGKKKLVEYTGMVPMDFALPYIQLFPSQSNQLGSLESVTLKNQDGTTANLSFDSDIVSQTRKILLQTICDGNDNEDAHNSESLVNFIDTEATSDNRSTNGIPKIDLQLYYVDGTSFPVTYRKLYFPSQLNKVLKFTNGTEQDITKQLGAVFSGTTSTDYIFDDSCKNIVPYYDLVLEVKYTVKTELFTMFANVHTLSVEQPVTRYYRITYSMLS